MIDRPFLQLQYGVNLHAQHVYDTYSPPDFTGFYPDPDANAIRETLARYTGVRPDMIMCGNGSDEVIDLYLRTYALQQPGLKVAVVPPNYYQYDAYGARVGCDIVKLNDDRSSITPAKLAALGCMPSNSVIMLDSPSNPTGAITPRSVFINLLSAGYRVFADEAYVEFYGQTVVDLIELFPEQLVVSRSLSKIAAMAGSRFGYMIAAPALVKAISRHKLYFNVTAESQARAAFALQHIDEFQKSVVVMRHIQQQTRALLAKNPRITLFSALPMYLLFTHQKYESEALQAILREQYGIEVYLYKGFNDHEVLRATVGGQEAMRRLVAALEEL